MVIKSFRHKGLGLFFQTGRKSGIQPHHAARIRLILGAVDDASGSQDLDSRRLGLHKLSGELAGFWAVKVSGNWRIVFRFEGEDATEVDYPDFHH